MGLKDKLNAALIKARNSKQAKKNPIGTLKTKPVQELPTKKITPEREKRSLTERQREIKRKMLAQGAPPTYTPKDYNISNANGQKLPNASSGYNKSMKELMIKKANELSSFDIDNLSTGELKKMDSGMYRANRKNK